MKKFTSIAIAFLLVLSVIPAMAGDQSGSAQESVTTPVVDQAPLAFQALSTLPATERQALVPLSDKELAAIEGEGVLIPCASAGIGCIGNFGGLVQKNIAGFPGASAQLNDGGVVQYFTITVGSPVPK